MGWFSTALSALGGPVGAAIGFGGEILGGVLNNVQQNKANNANMELAKYSFDRNLEMWNKQNEYNTPKNQMARYTEAGLNPNLIYSQGTPGVASNAPQYQAPEIRKYQNFGNLGTVSAVQLAQQQRQVDSTVALQAAQAASEKARARNIEADTNVKSIDHLSRLLKYGIDKETRSAVVGSILQNLENLKKTGDNIDSQTGLNKSRARVESQKEIGLKYENETLNPIKKRQMEADIAKTRQWINESQQNMQLTDAKTQEVFQSIRESVSRTFKNWQDQDESDARINEISARIMLIASQQKSLDAKTAMQEFETWYAKTYHIPLGANERQLVVGTLANLMTNIGSAVEDVKSWFKY